MSDPVTAAADGSPDPRSGMVAALAEVLAGHKLGYVRPYAGYCYGCGEWGSLENPKTACVESEFYAHVAAALAPTVERLVAEGRAEALEGGWDEACEALAWCLDNGPADSAAAYVSNNNPHRAAAVREGGDR